MPNQTKIDYSHFSIDDLLTESISLLSELAEICIDEAKLAVRKAQLLHDIQAVEADLVRRDA